ncbi:hypothetical protein I600_407 [Maribacter dokdonensis DSW-8]|nr:hypothetical protein I600_407 [Maribacter dokdonensis DSW-8]
MRYDGESGYDCNKIFISILGIPHRPIFPKPSNTNRNI